MQLLLLLYLHSQKWPKQSNIQVLSQPNISTLPTNYDLTEHGLISKISNKTIQEMTQSLRQKLREANVTKNHTLVFKSCKDRKIVNYDDTCTPNKTCVRTSLPEGAEERIRSLAFNRNMPVPDSYRDVLREMRDSLAGRYEVIIVSGVSSNHFMESQVLMKAVSQLVSQ